MRWVVIYVNSDDPHYRLFMTFGGSFVYGDSWRMNSGIVRVEKDGENLVFHGSSGSQYSVHPDGYGISAYGAGILQGYNDQIEGVMTVLPEETDWLTMDWIIGG